MHACVTCKHTDTQTHRHTGIQAYRHTDMQTCRHTYIQTHSLARSLARALARSLTHARTHSLTHLTSPQLNSPHSLLARSLAYHVFCERVCGYPIHIHTCPKHFCHAQKRIDRSLLNTTCRVPGDGDILPGCGGNDDEDRQHHPRRLLGLHGPGGMAPPTWPRWHGLGGMAQPAWPSRHGPDCVA